MTFRSQKMLQMASALALTAALVSPLAGHAQAVINEKTVGLTPLEGSMILGGGDVRQTVIRIINIALGFLGIIAVIIVLLGGFKYMTAGGEEEKTTEARKLMVSGIIGLAIILSAWAITQFVVSNLVTATTAPETAV